MAGALSLKVIHYLLLMRLGVCIPCHKPYLIYLEKCLESIENQTRKPDIVSISISEVELAPILPVFSFPVEITVSSDKLCQGKNRNLAASKIDVDILTFFDSDDIMHKQRLELIEKAFEKGLDGFLHNNKECLSRQYRNRSLNNYFWESVTNEVYTDGFSTTKDAICGRISSIHGNITNGHFSCKKAVWKALTYPEMYGLGEDSHYVYEVYNAGYKIGYSPDKLSYYIRDDFPEDPVLKELDTYNLYTSKFRPQVYSNYKNTEINNVIDYLLSDKSPERDCPIFIIDHVVNFPQFTMKKIIYNIEQMTRQSMIDLILPRMKLIDIVEIWDYSITNYNILKNHGFVVRHVPFKLNIEKILEYRNLQVLDKSYDIAFCGQIGPYRQSILDNLKSRNKKILILDGNYTNIRDIEIGRAKLLLNIHFNETYKVFEYIRCEPWLSSGFPVISESSLDDDPRAINVPYNKLVDKVCDYLDSMEVKPQDTIIFYCENLEMRNPKHYYEYNLDRDIYVYNMALDCKKKGYKVTIYAYTFFDNYNDITFKNPKTFESQSETDFLILLPPFNKSMLELQNINKTYICMDNLFNLTDYNLNKVSKIFFESKYIRNKYNYIPNNLCSIIYDCFNPIIDLKERSTFKIICTQPYNDELFNLIYSFWPFIRKIVPNAQFIIISDSSVLSPEHRQYLKCILDQPGIIERGLISKEEIQYEKKTSLIHINLSSTPESLESLEESIELGCLPILSNIYKIKYGIHIYEPTSAQKCIEKLIKIYLSLINTDSFIIQEYRTLLKVRNNKFSNSLIDNILDSNS